MRTASAGLYTMRSCDDLWHTRTDPIASRTKWRCGCITCFWLLLIIQFHALPGRLDGMPHFDDIVHVGWLGPCTWELSREHTLVAWSSAPTVLWIMPRRVLVASRSTFSRHKKISSALMLPPCSEWPTSSCCYSSNHEQNSRNVAAHWVVRHICINGQQKPANNNARCTNIQQQSWVVIFSGMISYRLLTGYCRRACSICRSR